MKKSFTTSGIVCTALAGLAITAGGCARTVQKEAEQTPVHSSIQGMPPRQPSAAMAPVCIYKMRKDYSRNVPVTMNAARTEIVSYPAPTDLKTNGRFAYPTPLVNGFWLDNRGINANVAFLAYTYEEYSKLPEAPSAEKLKEMIIDNNPLTEFHRCGQRNQYQDIVKELNELIAREYAD